MSPETVKRIKLEPKENHMSEKPVAVEFTDEQKEPPGITLTFRLHWEAGHRVMGNESKCRHFHGHRYMAAVTVSAPLAKGLWETHTKLGDWIARHLDHGFILNQNDVAAIAALDTFTREEREAEDDATATAVIDETIAPDDAEQSQFRQRIWFIEEGDPTPENIAAMLLERCDMILGSSSCVVVTKVRVWETPDSYADAVRG